jgi:transforming growth factor-beta-induced protein
MKSVKVVLLSALAFVLVFAVAAVSADGPKGTTVREVVEGSPSHNTLEAALDCTGLDAALEGNGQITLFAPTDEAFAGFGLNAGNICDVPGLAGILADHVAKGRRYSDQVVDSNSIKMISGDRFDVVVGSTVSVGGAELDLGNLDVDAAANGVIHFSNGIVGLGTNLP